MSFVKIQKKGQITLPSEVREKLALYEGNMIEVKVQAQTIILTPQVVIDRSDFPNADGEYTPEQRKKIDAELKEAMKGPFHGPFETHKEFIDFLHDEVKKRTAKDKEKAKRKP